MAGSGVRKGLLVVGIIIGCIVVLSLIVGVVGGKFRDKIGVVEIEGMITDTKDTVEDIVRFKDDDTVLGVIVRINSPGGSVGPTQEVFRELRKLGLKKRVYVSMGAVCASGGYYIASAGEKIYANPSTITGSIGVVMEQVVAEDLFRKIGLEPVTIKTGKFKDVGSPFRKMSEEERAYLQEILDSIYDQFLQDVADGRKMAIARVKSLADGRVYTGTQAQKEGLVDTIGTFYDSVDDLKKAVGLKGKPFLVYGKRPFSLLKWLITSLSNTIVNSRYTGSQFMYLHRF
jgi:protease IV